MSKEQNERHTLLAVLRLSRQRFSSHLTASYAQSANEISTAKIPCPVTALYLGPAGEVVGL